MFQLEAPHDLYSGSPLPRLEMRIHFELEHSPLSATSAGNLQSSKSRHSARKVLITSGCSFLSDAGTGPD